MSVHSRARAPAKMNLENDSGLRNRDKLRLEVIRDVLNKNLSVETAAHMLGLTTRQVYRLRTKAAHHGVRSVLHASLGRVPANKIKQETWDKVIFLARQKYQGLSYSQMQRRLEQDFKIRISRESLRKQLRQIGIGPQRKWLRR